MKLLRTSRLQAAETHLHRDRTRCFGAAIVLCIVLNMMDGYDILVIAFAAPSVAQAWNLSALQAGLLFSAGLVGMGLGAATLASLADRRGRRSVIMGCLLLSCGSMFAGSAAQCFGVLVLCRFFTGCGVGAMMPAINTVTAEYAGGRHRSLAVIFQAAGYPLGGVVGGLVSRQLFGHWGWRSIFVCGGSFSLSLVPLVWAWMPESQEFLTHRRAAARRRAAEGGGAPQTSVVDAAGFQALRQSGLLGRTAALCAVVFLVQFTFYFIVNWLPSLLATQRGQGVSQGIAINVGGIVGDLVFGILALVWSPRRLGILALESCFIGVAILGRTTPGGVAATVCAITVGCFLYASMACLYALAPMVFPTRARSTGTGLALSLGRIGGSLGPAAGVLAANGGILSRVDGPTILSVPLVAAALILWVTHLDKPSAVPTW